MDSSQSDDSFKSTRTSTSNQNAPINKSTADSDASSSPKESTASADRPNATTNEPSVQKSSTIDSAINDTSKDVTNDCLNDSSNDTSKASMKNVAKDENNSSKTDQTENTPSSSSIDLEQLISNLEISDENNELTNSLINLIHKRTSLHESVESKSRAQKKLSIVSLDMNGLVDYIKEKKCSKIIVMIGAGVSTCKLTLLNLSFS